MLPRLLPARGQVAGEAGKKEKRGGKRRIVVDEQDLEKLKEGHMDDNNKAAGRPGGWGWWLRLEETRTIELALEWAAKRVEELADEKTRAGEDQYQKLVLQLEEMRGLKLSLEAQLWKLWRWQRLWQPRQLWRFWWWGSSPLIWLKKKVGWSA